MGMADTFGARLIRARVEKGLTQSDLAAISGIAPAQVSRYEADKNQPRLLVLRKLAAALDIAPDRLLAGDDEADTEPADAAPTTQCKLRIPVDMHASLNKLAASANRSLNAEIVHRLAQTLGGITRELETRSTALLDHLSTTVAQAHAAQTEADQGEQGEHSALRVEPAVPVPMRAPLLWSSGLFARVRTDHLSLRITTTFMS